MQYQLLIHEFNPDSGRGHELTLNDQAIQNEFPTIPRVGDFISPHRERSGEVFRVLSVLIRYAAVIQMIHVTVVKTTNEEEWPIVPES